ncbi:hypothetical protein LTR37_017791 [Vermiconidia calcicola]|uniref:Uncharacterized protein n=1 Tax=Vermiconidia calcicola TaxID=1690605 RepID=A0ACC3MLS0_9PEZI|nr:hypothetical protein LTR37_017791 [Vermiconidia calcicola]
MVAFLLLLYVGPWRTSGQRDAHVQSNFGTYFNWRTPSSLFPPSAIISLTDDNSTFFLARPAAFGPLIPTKSLSGQLWIGSGFGDDHLGRSGGYGAGVEGELGCSDVPGWSDGGYVPNGKSLNEAKNSWAEGQQSENGKNRRRDLEYEDEERDVTVDVVSGPTESDGTDDHLHHPLPPSDGLKTNGEKKPTHADIQSLQESAEIAGKVVLLSRGGCGFLEKVKWVQRRGGVALIVGDDIRGGPLVTMYARGDTSNITIPSLFTSQTTAHLLSSLIPSGGAVDSISPEEAERLGLALAGKPEDGEDDEQKSDKPNFTTTNAAVESTPTAKSQDQYKDGRNPMDVKDGARADKASGRWFGLFGKARGNALDSRRPPNSGNVGWVLQEEFEDEEMVKYRKKQLKIGTSSSVAPYATPDSGSGDGFVIGVQDWRDPDLVAHQREQLDVSTSSSSASAAPQNTKAAYSNGDSITPGSGEYAKAVHEAVDIWNANRHAQDDSPRSEQSDHQSRSRGWFNRLFSAADDNQLADPTAQNVEQQGPKRASQPLHDHPHTVDDPEIHEGLWVTLTPTSMSSSPFFDTLLVLVVSPLVTLTVVYALLLLRSRIRRRRWRAPKSVVERLPVRTYQTMPSTTATSSTTSSISSPVSATTPLLPSNARPIKARSRPRSRTTPEGPVIAGSSLRSDGMASPSLEQVEEKRAAGLSEWRRRYGGKQRECVVCLEEYIDGVSRVMSLPCGHEFHAECITPWLTTRRRTCPICKGDVVRSLARNNSSSSPLPATDEDEEDVEDSDDVQEQAAIARNDDPAAAQPVSREDEMFEDLERGVGPDRTR